MNRVSEVLPSVLILGIDTPIGLTLIRELGEHGVPVYGIAHSKNAIGLASRFLTKGFVHSYGDDELITLINKIAETYQVHYLMTISEQRIIFLQNNLNRLIGIKALIPDVEPMRVVLNKDKVYELAEYIGINTPKNYKIENSIIPADIDYPVILKWPNPNTIMPLLNKYGIAFHKCEYCYSAQELLDALDRYKAIGIWPLIQSYCPGYGLGQMVFVHQRNAVLCFQHKRIHEWPPEGGFSTLCESVDLSENKALFDQSIELLRKINWEGPAMVEYRFDPKTNQATLMEINGRFWGSLPLAYHSGAYFCWAWYSLNVLKQVPSRAKIKANISCMFAIPEFKRLWQIMTQRERIQDRTLSFSVLDEIYVLIRHFIAGGRFYVFDIDDPKPFCYDVLNALKRVVKNTLGAI